MPFPPFPPTLEVKLAAVLGVLHGHDSIILWLLHASGLASHMIGFCLMQRFFMQRFWTQEQHTFLLAIVLLATSMHALLTIGFARLIQYWRLPCCCMWLAVLVLSSSVTALLQAPCPGAFCQGLDEEEMGRGLSAYMMRFSWIRLYAALLGTVQLLRGRKQASTVLDM